MRYRVESGERPDGLYATLDDRTFAAQRSTTDGTLLLTVVGDEEAPEGFDREHEGKPARVVLANEVPATFDLRTYVEYDDELFEVAPGDQPNLTLRWTRHDPVRAAQLGLTDFSVTVPGKQLTGLWLTRHDYGEPKAEVDGGDQTRILRGSAVHCARCPAAGRGSRRSSGRSATTPSWRSARSATRTARFRWRCPALRS